MMQLSRLAERVWSLCRHRNLLDSSSFFKLTSYRRHTFHLLSRRNFSQNILLPQFNKLVEASEERLDELPGVIKSPLTGEEKRGIQLFQVNDWPNRVETSNEEGSTSCVDILPPVYATHGEPGSWWGGIGYEAGYGGMFAVIVLKGKQFKICPDDIVVSEKLEQDINEKIVSDRVLAIGTMEYSLFGRPYLPFASVTLTVEQQTLTSEVVSFRFKKRKRYRRAWFHRQPITFLRVNNIEFIQPKKEQLSPLITARDSNAPLLAQNARIL
ncbi:mitochondrial ribosomal protein L21 precursor [Galdieria sulphuraria]|uniref:Large ribosomal subunit protein bL21m n=1 Tax=Galdieria sulphuraria TaxID=130081 RepID=M2XL65_GALSU|nr:mitochondrial ribosomal protein L21 precursor [Galdieria sulphuraria]EME30887.1 mitochondrial ribosomal protein L21 precursor [Galdieria sulphuraria]|eukprot:XP_005707407.1 mitochondrial ribosomal protein L21 precursor [Galdieria sulphuraria]